MIWLWLGAAVMVLTAVAHSVLGEKDLIGPLVRSDHALLDRPLARQELRLGWHLTSVLMLACAAVVAIPGTPVPAVVIVGAAWLACGIIDLVATRGRQEGWPFLTAGGILPLIGVIA